MTWMQAIRSYLQPKAASQTDDAHLSSLGLGDDPWGPSNYDLKDTHFRGFESKLTSQDRVAGRPNGGLAPSDLMAEYHQVSPRVRFQTEQVSHGDSPYYAAVYVSRAVHLEHMHAQLRAIRQTAALANFEAGLQTALIAQDGVFCQWLQGDQDAVEATLARIKRDDRHHAMISLYRGPAPPSMLDAWSMGMRSLYMPQGDAFVRAQLLRYRAVESAYTNPLDAWSDFTGISTTPKMVDGRDVSAMGAELGEAVVLVSQRSSRGAQLLQDVARGQLQGLAVTRWASVQDENCDLQTVSGLMPIGAAASYVSAVSAASLRVGAVREAIRHRKKMVLLLQSDDMSELDSLLTALDLNLPDDYQPRRLVIVAPHWTKATIAHARHLLQIRHWPCRTLALDTTKPWIWSSLAESLMN